MDKPSPGKSLPDGASPRGSTNRESAPETVVVAIATRQRPQMLATALAAVHAADPVPGAAIVIEVVDNDAAGTAEAVVRRAGDGRTVGYTVEPQPGVATVRNRAMDLALGSGARWLAFIDDDTFPEPGWLAALVGGLRANTAQLAGGPLLFAAPPQPLGAWRAFLCRGLVAGSRRRMGWNARRARDGKPVTIVTNTWCVDLDFVRRTGLRFDPRFDRSGGEDVAFYRALLRAGGKAVFVPEAVNRETVPASRLSLRYQLRRRFHSGMVRGDTVRREQGGAGALWHALPQALVSVVAGGLLLPAGLVTAFVARDAGAQMVVTGARMVGRGAGLVRGVFGGLPEQYRTVHGY